MHPPPPAGRVELALMDPAAGAPEVNAIVAEAVHRGHPAVWVTPRLVRHAVDRAAGRVRVGTFVAFPYGTSRPTIKAIEATAAVKDGAERLLVVPFLPDILAGDPRAVREELLEIVRGARAARPTTGVAVLADIPAILREADDERVEQRLAAMTTAVRQGGADGIVAGDTPAVDGTELTRTIPRLARQSADHLHLSAIWDGEELEDAIAALTGGAAKLIRVID